MAEEFTSRRLTGARFQRVDLSDATFDYVTFARSTFDDIDLTGVRMRNVLVTDVEINGDIDGLRINTVDVGPLIEAELDRRHPERVQLRPTDAAGFREAWSVIEEVWERTIDRASALPADLLHESVNGEWSFIETLRHLAFATDSWIRRAALGDPSPWHPLDLPWDEMPDTPGVPRDRSARPSLDVVLELRRDRMASVRAFVDELTDERLEGMTEPVEGPGWPPARPFPVREILSVILNEEFWHRVFAERDLDILTSEAG